MKRRPGPKKKPGVKPRMSKKEVLERLRKYFEYGLSINRACGAYNSAERDMAINDKREPFLIADRTVHQWNKNDPEFAKSIEDLQDSLNVFARKNWAQEIKNGDYQAAKDWLERKEKNEFSPRIALTGENGTPLFDTITVKISDE